MAQGPVSWKQFFHELGGLGVMVLGWSKSITLIVHLISNLMPLLIWQEVGVHSLEVGDPWPQTPAPSICLMLPSVWFFYSVSKYFGPLRNSWQKKRVIYIFLVPTPVHPTLPQRQTLPLSLLWVSVHHSIQLTNCWLSRSLGNQSFKGSLYKTQHGFSFSWLQRKKATFIWRNSHHTCYVAGPKKL